MTWYTVATTDEIKPGERIVVEIDDVWVVVFNVGGQYYALEDMCSHEEYYLSEGELDGYAIECPKHGAQFDVREQLDERQLEEAEEPVPTRGGEPPGQTVSFGCPTCGADYETHERLPAQDAERLAEDYAAVRQGAGQESPPSSLRKAPSVDAPSGPNWGNRATRSFTTLKLSTR